MILPALAPRDTTGSPTPPACEPFSFQSNECVGDLITVGVCGIAAIGFIIWGIHAIRKMRQFPFNYKEEDNEKPKDREKADHGRGSSGFKDSLLVQRGGVETPSIPERVWTRLALPEPEEEFYKASAPVLSYAYPAQGLVTAPRFPPPAASPARGQSWRSPLRRSGCDSGLPRGKAYSGGYERRVDEYVRPVSPSRARESRLHKPGGGYGSA